MHSNFIRPGRHFLEALHAAIMQFAASLSPGFSENLTVLPAAFFSL